MRELQVVIRIRRIDIAAAVSVLLHVLLFTLTPRMAAIDPLGPITHAPLNVTISEPQQAVPEPAPAPPEPVAQPQRPAPPPMITRRPALLPPRFPQPTVPPPVAPAPEPAPTPAPQVDMMAAIESRRAQRRAADASAARGAPSAAAPPQDAATRNLETLSGREGVGGVFQVLRKGVRTGEFAFNGWRPESRREWREVIEVDAGVGGNVELAMVKRMIELIRTHYTGDFHWDSHRLGRTVTLSARPPDQEGLEDFLMREFFGTPIVNPRRNRP